MTCWLWSIPPHNYPLCLEAGVFAVRTAGKAAVQRIRPGDRIFAYLPGHKCIAGIYVAETDYYYSEERIGPDGVFPHRIDVSAEVELPADRRVPLELFRDELSVGDQ